MGLHYLPQCVQKFRIITVPNDNLRLVMRKLAICDRQYEQFHLILSIFSFYTDTED